ncbi:MAG: hypothetical protein M3299_05845 [Thermoproteota archaeon]|nr:hypothetical protein [Thermoproteota archaeon]
MRKKKKSKEKIKKKISSVCITLCNTSAFSNEQVWEALSHVVPALKLKNHKKVDVTVTKKSSGNYTGTCYYNGCSWHNTPNPLIITRITSEEKKFPRITEYASGEGYINCLLLDRIEALILMLSHEFRHLWQKENEGTRRGKVWGARGIFSERDADAFAIRKVREYRRRQQQPHLSLLLPSLHL